MAMTSCIPMLLTVLSLSPPGDVAWDNVDLVEVNHFYDDRGRHVFDQVIFYDWCSKQCRFNVRAWRLMKKPGQMPQRDWRTNKYVAVWHDGAVLRKVQADHFRETWSQRDPELEERAFLPKNQRRELLQIGKLAAKP